MNDKPMIDIKISGIAGPDTKAGGSKIIKKDGIFFK